MKTKKYRPIKQPAAVMMLVGMIRAANDPFHLVQTTSNLLVGIQPTITGANSDFFGLHKADPRCFNSSGISD
jgi:hypothetical protein